MRGFFYAFAGHARAARMPVACDAPRLYCRVVVANRGTAEL